MTGPVRFPSPHSIRLPLARIVAGAALWLAGTTAAAAQAAAAPAEPPAFLQFLPLVAMVGVFYFLILRPQMRKQKDHATKIAALQKGDQVVTAGGLIAKVIRVDEHTVDLEIAPNVRVKAVKSTLGDIVPPGGAAPAND